MNRRAFLSVLGASPAVLPLRPAAAGVETSSSVPPGAQVETPPYSAVMTSSCHHRDLALAQPSCHQHSFAPANTRPDGSVRHRQHHPVDFPPRR